MENTDKCEVALHRALELARMDVRELDAVFIAATTAHEHDFSDDVMTLNQRLRCREDAFALVIDNASGGAPYLLDLARRTIQGGAFRTVAILGFALASPTLSSDLLTSTIAPAPQGPVNAPSLSIYTHRDGAGAIVLRGENAR